MRLIDEMRDSVSKPEFASQLTRVDYRSIEIRLLERISEAVLQLGEHRWAGVRRHGSAKRLRDRPQLIDSMAMIAMGVGNDHSVEEARFRCQQLLAKVGPAVDEYLTAAAFHQD